MAFKVVVVGEEKLHKNINDDIPKSVKKLGFEIRGKLLKQAKENAKPRGATGRLADSIKGQFVANQKIAFKARVFSNNPVARDVEEGRKGSQPSLAAVKRWAKRLGLDTHRSTLRRLQKAMRHSRPLRYMERAAEDTNIGPLIREAEAAIEREWST